jgi:transcriptional regulator with XRE-family HTH domain
VIDLAGTLRAERERAGLTLEEISARTKIKVAFLQALERGDFEQLPGNFFARAFLRTYARELHLPADEIIAAYETRCVGVTPEARTQVVAAPPKLRRRVDWSLSVPSPQSAWPTLALAIAVLAVLYAIGRRPVDVPSTTVAVGTSGIAEPSVAPSPAAVATVRRQNLTLEIRASRVMWVAGMADGKRVIYRLVEPGEVVRVEAHQDLWFRVGDAGAFVYSINGSPGKALGASGEVREFRITHDNYRALVE